MPIGSWGRLIVAVKLRVDGRMRMVSGNGEADRQARRDWAGYEVRLAGMIFGS